MDRKYKTRKLKSQRKKNLTRGGNRHRKTVAEVLRNSGVFNNVRKTKKEQRKILIEIEKIIAKENKEQYKQENKEDKEN